MNGMHSHDGYAPHSHEVRADHGGVSRKPAAPYSDTTALDRISSLLVSGKYHDDAVTLSEIATIVTATGRSAGST